MPAWGNTDNHNQKPKFDLEREIRAANNTLQLLTANTTNAGNTVVTLVYNDGGQNNLANIGVAVGQSIYFSTGLAGNGTPGFFAANNTVASINGNNVVLSSATFNTTNTGTIITFGKNIVYNTNKPSEVNYNLNTVLVTPTRLANAVFSGTYTSANLANSGAAAAHVGWVNVTTGTGGRAGRVQTEVLVALANPVAANTLSGNTSNSGTYFAGI